jgi:hypothetical protein
MASQLGGTGRPEREGVEKMRLPRKLLLLVSMVGVFSMLGAGVAFADHTGGTEWTCNTGATVDGELCTDRNPIGPAASQIGPVGGNIADPGRAKAFAGGTPSNAVNAINNNPLCPFHGVAGP